MKALSLWQPWATLIAIGVKQYETRSWATPYRGPLLIHAARRFQLEERQTCLISPFRECLQKAGYKSTYDLPLGAYIAVAYLIEIVPTRAIRNNLSGQESAFGNYADGRYAWKLERVQALPEPIPARGYQGLWNPLEGLDAPMVQLINDLYRKGEG